MNVQKSAAVCSFGGYPLDGGVETSAQPRLMSAYVRNDGWTGLAWHLDKSVHPWHQLSLHDSRRKRPNITDTCSGDINTSWLFSGFRWWLQVPHHTFPSISSFRPLTHQSHLIGLTLHLQLCLITCCFLPPSVRRSPPSSSCCSSSSVSLPWRAVVPSLELFIIFFKQREKKKPTNTGKRLHHWKWQSHFLIFSPLFNTKQELLAFLIMQSAVAVAD